MDGSFFSLSHPTPSKAATPPKPIPFRVKHLNSFQASLYFNRLDAASRQGRAGQGRAGQDRGQGRGRAGAGQGRAGQGRAGAGSWSLKVWVAQGRGSAPGLTSQMAPPLSIQSLPDVLWVQAP